MQKEAIEKVSGPCVILAGAGTGKTYTIVEKIRYLIKNKIYNPERIVCLTFSNEAANSLRNRILPILQGNEEPIIRTFHSFCADLLRTHGMKIGVNPKFKILLPDDMKIILHKNFKVPAYWCLRYSNSISIAKDLGISLQTINDYIEKQLSKYPNIDLEKEVENLQFRLHTAHIRKENKEDKKELEKRVQVLSHLLNLKKFVQSWRGYEKIKELKGAQDYADLNKNALTLLQQYPSITKEYDYIIVDEFQDTNKLQCDLLELLAENKGITIVGDLNQSIYRFRGAYKDNFSNFKKSFKTTKEDIFALDKSFRSPNKVLKTAYQLIQNNYTNKEDCFPVHNASQKEGDNIKIFELKNEKEEARKIVEIIESVHDRVPYEEICVMFRTHQQSRLLKRCLEAKNIPFNSITRKSLLKIEPIKLTLDYISIGHTLDKKKQGADHSWWDLIYNSKFNKEDILIITKFMREHRNDDCLSESVMNHVQSLLLSEEGKIKINSIIKNIRDILPSFNKPLPELVREIYKLLPLESPEKTKEGKESILNLEKFHEWVKDLYESETPDIESFLHHLEIINSLGIDLESVSIEKGGVRIMTHHATKGLEYKVIILAAMAQKKFPVEKINHDLLIPSALSPELASFLINVPENETEEIIEKYEQDNQLLEERRLCYVAFTRTKEQLFITYAQEYGGKKHSPSQFLSEINYKENENISFEQDSEEKYKEPELTISSADSLNLSTEKLVFSPSSLILYSECQKRYEYRYVYNMPEENNLSWEEIALGSFIHLILQEGVDKNYKTEKEFYDHAKLLHSEEMWKTVNLDEATTLLKIFFERNKNKYNDRSLTEKKLRAHIEGMNFEGYADRIDIHDDGAEIIDYKTGKTPISPKQRNWQLGFYALSVGSWTNVKRLTLDMLRKDKPLEFDIDKEGNALERNSGRMSFNLFEVKDELISTAKKIIDSYKNGFTPCPIEKNCQFCNDLVWDKK